jgi:hypothetical protein
MIGVEPKNPERDDLVKRCRRKSFDGCIPHQLWVRDGLDVQYEEGPVHRTNLAEKRLVFTPMHTEESRTIFAP